MTNRIPWHEANACHLSAAIHWLRLKLQQRMPDATVTDAEIASAEESMSEAAAIEPPPALITLSSVLGLTEFEQSLLLLCAAMELDTQIASFCAKVQDDSQRAYPTFALALSLFDQPFWDVVSPERPLRSWRLIEIHQSGAQPLTVSPIKADERIVNYLKGLNYLDDRLSALLSPVTIPVAAESPAQLLAPSQQQVAETIAEQVDAIPHWYQVPLLQLLPRLP